MTGKSVKTQQADGAFEKKVLLSYPMEEGCRA
jgi:hypothetical protein